MADDTLRQRAQLLSESQLIANIGSWRMDSDGLITWSDETWRLFGLSPSRDPLSWEAMLAVVHPDDREAFQAGADALRTGGELSGLEFRVVRSDGTVHHIHGRGRLMGEAGHEYIVGTVQDVTEQRRAEVELARAKARLELATRAGRIGVWEWDVVNDRLFWDDQMFELYGVRREEFSGAYEAWLSGIHPDDRARCEEEWRQVIRGSATYETVFRVRWPDSTVRTIAATARVLADLDGLRMIGVNYDITERERSADDLRAALVERDALLMEVHHRVKNNLQVVASLLRLEGDRTAHPAASAVLANMKNRILAMALLHETLYRSRSVAQVDLATYFRQLAQQVSRSVAPENGVNVRLNLATAPVDPDQAITCGLILNELVSNALKHAFPDGRSGEIQVDLQPVNAGSQLCLRVSDNGVGLPADFDYTRCRSLGLQLVGDLTHQLQGVLVVSPPGEGASFTATFTPRQTAVKRGPASQENAS